MSIVSHVSGTSRATSFNLASLLSPRAIAIVGAVEDPKRPGGQPVMTLSKFGYQGKIYPVNPKYSTIQGLACYPDISSVPADCEVALIALPSQGIPEAITQCGQAGIPFAVILSAGFGEVGNAELQARLVQAIQSSGVRVVGPNCTGILNLKDSVFNGFGAGFRNPNLKRGSVAMVTQSGGFGYSVLAFAEHEGIGFNALISTGNEVDLNSLDMIAYLLECADVEVVVCYMEGVKDGQRLRQLGQRALELRKPIVIWKVGNTGQGAKAALSHTANLTASYSLYQAVFEEGGFVEIDDVYDLVDVVSAFRGKRLPAGNRVGVLTTSGGAGVLLADRCEQHGMVIAGLEEATRAHLRTLAPGFAIIENPVDLSAGVAQNPAAFNEATQVLLDDPNIDSVIVRSFPGADQEAWAEGLCRIAQNSQKPILVSLSGLALNSKKASDALERQGIACFATPGRAVRGAKALADYATKLTRYARVAEDRVGSRVELDLASDALALSERQSKASLAAYGIAVVKEVAIALDALDAPCPVLPDFPVVVKVDSSDVPHKTEAGAVKVGVRDWACVQSSAREILASTRNFNPAARIDGVLVQEMAKGLELIVGSVNDPVFGPYILLGMGGILAEVIQDTTIAFAPFGLDTAREMIGKIKGAVLLRGYRGAPPSDIEALAEAIARLSWLAFDHADRIDEIDINPLFVRQQGQGVVAADCLIVKRGLPAVQPSQQ